jgi:hypothetical protein
MWDGDVPETESLVEVYPKQPHIGFNLLNAEERVAAFELLYALREEILNCMPNYTDF